MTHSSHVIACYIQSPYIGTDKVLAILQRKLEAAVNENALAVQDHEAEQMRQKESAEMAAVAATAASEAAAVVVADNANSSAAAAAVTLQEISSDRYV